MLRRILFALTLALGVIAQSANTTAPYNDQDLMMLGVEWQLFNEAFISQGLANFTEEDFVNSTFPSWAYGRIKQMLQHSQARISDAAAQSNHSLPSCTYQFPNFPTAYDWTAYFCGIKQLGASGYIGFLPFLEDPGFRLVVGSILSDEARDQAFIYGPLFKGPMWTGTYDTYVSPDELYSLMSLFQKCNTTLPFKTYPPIVFNGNPIGFDGNIGDQINVTWAQSTGNETVSLANGLTNEFVQLNNGNMTVPAGYQGWTWVTLTNATSIEDYTRDTILAGPGFIHVDFNSSASNPGLPVTPLVLEGYVP